jgi:alcohol dehydrogenase class IV
MIPPLSIPAEARLEFAPGAIDRIPGLIAGLGHQRVFVITDMGLRKAGLLTRVLDILEHAGFEFSCYEGVSANPSRSIVDQGAANAREFGSAAVLTLGGGSAMDAAKAITVAAYPAEALPVIAVPTTAGTGAECNGFGVIEDHENHCKVYLGDESVRPRVVVLDPELTVGLPAPVTAATGFDALVHGIESLSSPRANPLSTAYAAQAVGTVSRWLPVAVADGADLEARSHLMFGAHLAGRALTLSGLGLVHGFAHTITAHLGTPHGVALAAVADTVMRFSATVATTAYAQVADAMDTTDCVERIAELTAEIGLRARLTDLGATEGLLPALAAGALADAVTDNAPRRPTEDEALELLASVL